MGWGTSFKKEIYLSHKFFNDKYELEVQIEQNKKWIDTNIQKLKMFASANPRDIVDIEWKEEPITWLNNQIDEIVESIEETSFENYQLNLYLDYINEECNGEIPKINTNE